MPQSRVLLVEPDDRVRASLAASIERIAFVHAHIGFETARTRLLASAPDLLVTNVRLDQYNGLHLTYLATQSNLATRSLVYATDWNLGTANDVQRAGAFFELLRRMPVALPGYVGAALPLRDRRDTSRFDRRASSRGGRRLWDVHALGTWSAV